MNSGWNPTRRNRNLGTAQSEHGQNNRMAIPHSYHDPRAVYWQRLTSYKVTRRQVNSLEITFLVEKTRADCVHACTIDDLVQMLLQVPGKDLRGIELIVLRRPRLKESLLSSVWGRLAYFACFGKYEGPSIILEAQDVRKPRRWNKSLTPDWAAELERLRADGHRITEDKRQYVIESTIDSARATQLYRTLTHEIGHWVDYLSSVEEPSDQGHDYSSLWDRYDRKPSVDKESFAHQYADRLKCKLIAARVIPFERILDEQNLAKAGLRSDDFLFQTPDQICTEQP